MALQTTPSGRPINDDAQTRGILGKGLTSLAMLSGKSSGGVLEKDGISASAPAAPQPTQMAAQTAESFLGAAPITPSLTGGMS